MVIKKTFPANDQEMDTAIGFIEQELEYVNFPAALMVKIPVACEEVFVNICHYAYPDSLGDVTIEISRDSNRFQVEFIDSGIPFNPLAHEKTDISVPIVDRPIGGLGIFMVRKWADEVSYRYEDGQNILTIVKKC